MLVILVGFTENKGINLLIGFSILLLLAFSSYGLAIWGVNETTTNTIFIMGSFSVLVFATTIFAGFLKTGIGEKKQLHTAIILGVIVFAFGSFAFLHSLNMIYPAQHGNDIWELTGIITLMASTAIGTTVAIHRHQYPLRSEIKTVQFKKKEDRFPLNVDRSPLRAVR
jgi:MFS family permease